MWRYPSEEGEYEVMSIYTILSLDLIASLGKLVLWGLLSRHVKQLPHEMNCWFPGRSRYLILSVWQCPYVMCMSWERLIVSDVFIGAAMAWMRVDDRRVSHSRHNERQSSVIFEFDADLPYC